MSVPYLGCIRHIDILIHFILFQVSVRVRYRAPLNSPIINVPLLLMNQVTLSHLAMPEATQLLGYYLVYFNKINLCRDAKLPVVFSNNCTCFGL